MIKEQKHSALYALLLIIAMSWSSILTAQLAGGTYIIGNQPGDDYGTIGTAVNDLNTNGIAGAVVFELRGDTFEESITIRSINGASNTSTVTFKSITGETAIWLKPSSANRTLVLTDSAHNIAFNGIRFVGNGTASVMIELNTLLHNIEFHNSTFDAPSASEHIRGYFIPDSNYYVEGLVFNNNTFLRGASAITIYLASWNVKNGTVEFTNNLFSNQTGEVIKVNYLDSLIIKNNKFNYAPNNSSTTTDRSIVRSDGIKTTIIKNNHFTNTNINIIFDIFYYLDFQRSVSTTDIHKAFIHNNIFESTFLLPNVSMFYTNYLTENHFTHNTILSNSSKEFFSLGWSRLVVNENNIYFNLSHNTSLLYFNNLNMDSLNIKKNLFYHSNNTAATSLRVAGTDYTYAEAIDSNWLDNNYYFDPQLSFVNGYPHPGFSSPIIGNGAVDSTLDTLDFFGYPRNNPPTIGALEYPAYNNWPWQVQSTAHYFPLRIAPNTILPYSNGDSLQNGDYIGAFYSDNLGGVHCAGFTKWGNGDTVVQMDAFQQINDLSGIIYGDTPIIRVWRHVDSCELYIGKAASLHQNIGQQLIDSIIIQPIVASIPTLTYPTDYYCNSSTDTIQPILSGLADSVVQFYNDIGPIDLHIGQGRLNPKGHLPTSIVMRGDAGQYCLQGKEHTLNIIDSIPSNIQINPDEVFAYNKQSVDLALNIDTTYYRIHWNTGDTSLHNQVDSNGTYTYQVQNKICPDQLHTNSYKVSFVDNITYPNDSFDINHSICRYPGSVYLHEDKISGGIPPYTIQLQQTDGAYYQAVTTPNTLLYDMRKGNYQLSIADSLGNSEDIDILDIEEQCTDLIISVNGDGVNDFIYLFADDETVTEAKLFDRRGNLLTKLPIPTYWSGVDANDRYLPTGIYLVQMNKQHIPVTIMR